ncbi:MAG: hypothetical protein ACYDCK_08595 [Thermoplasmatota archaeon]
MRAVAVAAVVALVASALAVVPRVGGTAPSVFVAHAPIDIEGDASFCVSNGEGGWRDTGVVNCDAPGVGSAAIPYRIAGWHIDAQGFFAIRVRQTTRPFTVEHNLLDNSLKGETVEADGVFYLGGCPGETTPASPDCLTWPRVVVANNTILDMTNGVRAFVFPTIAGPYAQGEALHLADNVIASSWLGAAVAVPGRVEHNAFVGDDRALSLGDLASAGAWRVLGNDFVANGDGISFDESVQPAPNALIAGNSFRETSGLALVAGAPVAAPDNWWGDAAGPAQAIPTGGSIGGGANSARVSGPVVAAPWADAPIADAGPR